MAAVLVVVFSVAAHGRVAAWKDSITFYDDILAKDPKAVFAYSNRAAARLTEQQDPAAAVRDCDAAIALDAGYAEAYFNRSTAEMLLRKFPEALVDANKSIELNGARRQYFQLRAEARLAVGDAKGALADSTQAIELNPGSAAAYLVRGRVRVRAGDLVQAAHLGRCDARELAQQLCN